VTHLAAIVLLAAAGNPMAAQGLPPNGTHYTDE